MFYKLFARVFNYWCKKNISKGCFIAVHSYLWYKEFYPEEVKRSLEYMEKIFKEQKGVVK